MSKAFTSFESIFKRANDILDGSQSLVDIYNKLVTKSDESISYDSWHSASDMGRAAVVLAVAAMDDYFTRKYAEVLVPTIKKRGVTKEFCEILSQSGLDIKASLELMTMSKPYRRIRTMAEKYWSDYTTQRSNKIDHLFATIGLNRLSINAQRKSKRKGLLKSISILVDRRNQIVHAGDMSKRGKLEKLNPAIISKRLKDIELFVKNCEIIINNFAFTDRTQKDSNDKKV
jgi:hypothetical protein